MVLKLLYIERKKSELSVKLQISVIQVIFQYRHVPNMNRYTHVKDSLFVVCLKFMGKLVSYILTGNSALHLAH